MSPSSESVKRKDEEGKEGKKRRQASEDEGEDGPLRCEDCSCRG
jgi:hypothetical protein